MASFFKVIILIFMLNCAFNQKSNKKIKAAIFDLDGTLLDTQRLYDEANQIVINQYGNGKKYDADLQVKIHGAPPSFGNKYLIDYFEIKLTMDEFMGKKDEYLKEKIPHCKPMEGVKELTHLLKHKYGLKLAIATSAFKNSTDIKLTNHKDWIKEDFDIMITGEDKRIKKGKPSPDIFLVAANDLGVKPEECIIRRQFLVIGKTLLVHQTHDVAIHLHFGCAAGNTGIIRLRGGITLNASAVAVERHLVANS